MSYFKQIAWMNAALSAISTASPALNANAAPMVWVSILSATGAQNLTNPLLVIPAAKARLASASNQSGGDLHDQAGHLEQRDEVGRGENRRRLRIAGALQLLEPRRRVGEEIPPQRPRHGVENIERRLPREMCRIDHRDVRAFHGDGRKHHHAAMARQRREAPAVGAEYVAEPDQRLPAIEVDADQHASDRIGQIVMAARGMVDRIAARSARCAAPARRAGPTSAAGRATRRDGR